VADNRLKIWETLFQRALVLIDSAANAGAVIRGWSFGGGTVLMRRHRHRLSKDIDIFVSDPQYLGYLTPRLNAEAEKLTTDYAEDASSLKLRFPEGEIGTRLTAGNPTDPAGSSRCSVREDPSERCCAEGSLWRAGSAGVSAQFR